VGVQLLEPDMLREIETIVAIQENNRLRRVLDSSVNAMITLGLAAAPWCRL
jgi:hypothetical protein